MSSSSSVGERATDTRRVALVFGYDGTEFYGSQTQPGRRTVQGELQAALDRIAPGSGKVVLAGRTDRGVHAVGQVASVSVAWRRSLDTLRDGLNATLADDVVVSSVVEVPDEFHARYDARWREYRYGIVVADVTPVLARRYWWWRRTKIDSARAAAACERLVGRKAFGTFAGAGRSRVSQSHELVRTIRECHWTVKALTGQTALKEERHVFRVVADGYLPHMVRNMVAAVYEVARGARPELWIDDLLAANDRRALGEAAPAHGLVLWRVEYDGDWIRTGTG